MVGLSSVKHYLRLGSVVPEVGPVKAGPEGLTGGASPEALEPVGSLVGLLLVAPAAEPEGPG